MAADSSHSLQRGADSQSTSSAQSELNSAKKARRAAPKIPSSSDEDDAVSDPHAGEEEESWEKQEFPVLGPTSDGLFDRSHAERYKLRKSWESLVERIGTADNETEDRLCFLVLWKDTSFSWVSAAMVRSKCPQKLIDFFEAHIRFTSPSPD